MYTTSTDKFAKYLLDKRNRFYAAWVKSGYTNKYYENRVIEYGNKFNMLIRELELMQKEQINKITNR